MEVATYLTFDGRCAQAFKFYERALGGQIQMMMTHGESPMAEKAPAAWKNMIMHARMTVGDNNVLMGSDFPPEDYEGSKGFSVSLGVETQQEAERVFKALSEKGNVRMPLQQTFWAQAFGMLTDQFGVSWMVNFEGRPA